MASMRERTKEAAQRAASGGSSYIKIPENHKVNFFGAKANQEYELDFLPYEVTIPNHPEGVAVGDLWYAKAIKVHYGIGADDKSYICRRTIGEACPICEAQKLLAKDASVTKEEADSLLPKDRTIFQVIDLKDEAKGIQIWEISYHLFTKKLLQEINKTENSQSARRRTTPHGGFAELEGGQTLIVSFEEKSMGKGKPFANCDRIDADDRAPYEDAILDEVLDLDNIIEVKSYEELESIFLSQAAAAEPAHDDTPPARGARGARGAAAEPEPAATSARPARGARGAAAAEPEPTPATTSRRGARGAAAEPEPAPAATSRRGARGAATAAQEPAEAPTTTTRRGRGAAAEPEPAPAATGRTRTRAAAPVENPCPFGFQYGVDCETKDECIDKCPEEVWTACKAIKEGN